MVLNEKGLGPEAPSSETTLNMVKWWLVQCECVDRARTHSMRHPRFEAFIPPSHVLEDEAKVLIPPDDGLCDDELDARHFHDKPELAVATRKPRPGIGFFRLEDCCF